MNHISYLFKCCYFWKYSPCHFNCWLLLGKSFDAFDPPSSPLPPHKESINLDNIYKCLSLTSDIRSNIYLLGKKTGAGGKWLWFITDCRSVCWFKGHFCANYSNTGREWESSSHLNRKAWPSCRETLHTNVFLVAVTNLILFQHVNYSQRERYIILLGQKKKIMFETSHIILYCFFFFLSCKSKHCLDIRLYLIRIHNTFIT